MKQNAYWETGGTDQKNLKSPLLLFVLGRTFCPHRTPHPQVPRLRLRRARLAEAPGIRVADVDAPSPFVAFEQEGIAAPDVVAGLEAQGIIARYLPGTDLTRISVGCWNDRSDVDRLASACGSGSKTG